MKDRSLLALARTLSHEYVRECYLGGRSFSTKWDMVLVMGWIMSVSLQNSFFLEENPQIPVMGITSYDYILVEVEKNNKRRSSPDPESVRTIKIHGLGLPWWLRDKESACQCRRCGFHPQSECHNYWACALGPMNLNYWSLSALELVLRNMKSHHNKEAGAPQRRIASAQPNWRKSMQQQRTSTAKHKKINLLKKNSLAEALISNVMVFWGWEGVRFTRGHDLEALCMVGLASS